MFWGKRKSASYNKGRELFERGMLAASRYECDEAIRLYTASIQAEDNPAPYINRAKIFSFRLRHFEALKDLETARDLDLQQERQFLKQIDSEIGIAKLLTVNYRNGVREKLIADYRLRDTMSVARELLDACCQHDLDLTEHHFFQEIDNIAKFDSFKGYPDAREDFELYTQSFIDRKLVNCLDSRAYTIMKMTYESFMCCYPPAEMIAVRAHFLYEAHERLLERDYGAFHMSLRSSCLGVIKEAESLVRNRLR